MERSAPRNDAHAPPGGDGVELTTRPLVLAARAISKRFGHVQALRDVTISVAASEVVGLIGENGSGKSTLLSVMSGVLAQDAGTIERNGQDVTLRSYHEANAAGIFRVYQEPALLPNLRVFENFFLGYESMFVRGGLLSRKRMIAATRSQLSALGIELDVTAPLRTLPMHVRAMIEIARAMAMATILEVDHPVIFLDEATASLTADEVEQLFDLVRSMRARAAFVFVSHRLEEILNQTDRVYVLKDGNLIAEADPAVHTGEDFHELMVGRVREREFYSEDRQRDLDGEEVLAVSNLSGHAAARGAAPFRDVSLRLAKGEILGIGGVVGSGKSEFGRALVGDVKVGSGTVALNGVAVGKASMERRFAQGMGYVPLDRHAEGIILYQSLERNLTLTVLDRVLRRLRLLVAPAKERSIARDLIGRFGIAAPSERTLPINLSGGTQQKAVIAKWLAPDDVRVLVVDNPTRGVDAGAKYEIYTLLRELTADGLAIVLITDDLPELIGLSNRILIMRDGAITRELPAPSADKPTEHAVVAHMV